jgi:hypothetical protein
MGWWMAAAATANIGLGISSNRKAKKAGRRNARYIKWETEETIRRMDREQVMRVGSAQTQYASRGILNAGSFNSVMEQLHEEYQKQRRWTKESGDRRAHLAKKGGSYIGASNIIQGIGMLGSAFGGGDPSSGGSSWPDQMGP